MRNPRVRRKLRRKRPGRARYFQDLFDRSISICMPKAARGATSLPIFRDLEAKLEEAKRTQKILAIAGSPDAHQYTEQIKSIEGLIIERDKPTNVIVYSRSKTK